MDPAKSPAELLLGRLDQLPTLPSIAIRILEIVLDSESSSRDAARVVEVDPALTTKVLRIVNSPAYGFRRTVNDVKHAITLLGFGSLRSIVMSVSVFDSLLQAHSGSGLDKIAYWQHCLATAAAARAIARGVRFDAPEEAYLAGLLHDVGKVVIDRNAPREYLEVAARLKAEAVEPAVAEHDRFRTDHAAVGALLLARWHLPAPVTEAVRLHHHLAGGLPNDLPERTARLAAITAAADFVAWMQGMSSVEAKRPPALDAGFRALLGFDALDLEAVTGEIERELTRMSEVFRIEVPDAQQLRRALQTANEELGRMGGLYEEARRQLELRTKELKELNEAIRLARLTLDPDEVRHAIVNVVQGGLGFDRASYFAVDWEGRWIAGREIRDNSEMEARKAEVFFALEPDDDFLARCSVEGGPFPVRAGEDKGLAARLLHHFDVGELVAAPIFSRSYLTGLVLADNAFSRRAISAEAVQALGILASETGLAMENALLFEKMRELAIRDELTGLYNRRHLLESLAYEMERARRYGRPFSVLLGDIDRFKGINEAFGPQIGDRVLKEVAAVLREASRDVDILGRYGGEEFLVLLPETGVEQAMTYGERLRKAVEARGALLTEEMPGLELTLSMGVADFVYGRDPTRDSLLQRAEQAVANAKKAGRNCVLAAVDARSRMG